MRYVIAVVALALLIIWDGLYNEGRFVDRTVREVKRITALVGA